MGLRRCAGNGHKNDVEALHLQWVCDVDRGEKMIGVPGQHALAALRGRWPVGVVNGAGGGAESGRVLITHPRQRDGAGGGGWRWLRREGMWEREIERER